MAVKVISGGSVGGPPGQANLQGHLIVWTPVTCLHSPGGGGCRGV